MPHKDPVARALYHKEYSQRHRDKLRTYRNEYRKEHPEEERSWQESYREGSVEKRKEYVRSYRYGVSPEQYNGMLLTQNNTCAICKNPFIKTPHIDHCHTTGKVRGLLCGPCNTGLGVYEKRATDFKKYLEENG